MVRVSVGVAEALPGEQADSWHARADVALYRAKAQGRNCVVIAAGDSQTTQ
jgi:PleD family two-component response regulator